MKSWELWAIVAFAGLGTTAAQAQDRSGDTTAASGKESGTASPAGQEKRPPISTDRPGFANSTDIVPLHTIQLETGYTFSHLNDERIHSLGQALLRVPLGQRVEIRLGVPSYNWSHKADGDAAGFTDMSVGFKAKLLVGSEKFRLLQPTITLVGGTTLPTGSNAFRVDRLQPQAQLDFEWPISSRANLDGSLTDTLASQPEGPFNQFAVGVSLNYVLAKRLGFFGEAYSILPGSRGGHTESFTSTGLLYALSNDMQVDINGGYSLNGAGYSLGAGLARRW